MAVITVNDTKQSVRRCLFVGQDEHINATVETCPLVVPCRNISGQSLLSPLKNQSAHFAGAEALGFKSLVGELLGVVDL